MSALRLINETTASSVASVSVTDVFTSDFDIYKIVFTDIDQSSSGGSHSNISFINSSGSEVTDAIYDYAQMQLKGYSSFGTDKYVNQRYIRLVEQVTGNSAIGSGAVCYIFNPTNSNSYTFGLGQSQGFYETAGSLGSKGIGVLKQTSSITGFKFFSQNVITYDSIKFKIYGLRVDS